MDDRTGEIDRFLAKSGWLGAQKSPLAGDASNRRYFRIRHRARGAVLMDAPPKSGEDVQPFLRIAHWLKRAEFSAPEILCADKARGLLLIEDLGDDLVARVVEADASREAALYEVATDVLVKLHQCETPSGLVTYSPQLMAEMTAPVFEWYLTACGQDASIQARFIDQFQGILTTHCDTTDVLALRDYHAENLLWLPSRSGVARMGLLDFQDALIGHRAYDLVSLLHDIRRDVSSSTEAQMLKRYLDAAGLEASPFSAAYAALGLQRNLRIMGIFSRLCLKAGKPHYVDFLPRIWRLILKELEHPVLAPIKPFIVNHVPPPTPAIIRKLKDRCGTIQTP